VFGHGSNTASEEKSYLPEAGLHLHSTPARDDLQWHLDARNGKRR
jgi:hypothetical protein